MQLPALSSYAASNPNPKLKEIILIRSFFIFGMKPDLTYYHIPLLRLKNFSYFPDKKNLANFPTPSLKQKHSFYSFLKKTYNILGRLLIKHKIKKVLIPRMATDLILTLLI